MFKSKFMEKDTLISLCPSSMFIKDFENYSEIKLKFVIESGKYKEIISKIENIKFYIFKKNNDNKILAHIEHQLENIENNNSLEFILKKYFFENNFFKLGVLLMDAGVENSQLYCINREEYELYITDDQKLIINFMVEV